MALAAAVLCGCARPAGELFPVRQSPRAWPPQPETARIRWVGALSDSNDLHAAKSSTEALGEVLRGRRPPLKFVTPHAVAVKDGGQVAVADSAGACIHIFDLTNRTHLRVAGYDEQVFQSPVGVVWVGDELLVSDAGRKEVVRLDANGRHLGEFGKDSLQRPVGIAFSHARRHCYVVDGDAHRINVYSTAGEQVEVIGQRGSGPGEFNYPSHVCVHGDRLIVADSGNFRVQILTLDGSFVRSIGQKGNGAGDFALPKGVAVDGDGHIYVVDARFENVQVFNEQGQLLLSFGEEGDKPGEFSLPAGIIIDAQDRVWVADGGNGRLQVFQYLRNPS